MTDRERLVEIFQQLTVDGRCVPMGEVIDHLIAHGVTVQKHGRWEGLEYDGYADGCPVYDLWECSECGEEVRGEDVPQALIYCPNCGAKMDGEADVN